jgi:hypothetical protein
LWIQKENSKFLSPNPFSLGWYLYLYFTYKERQQEWGYRVKCTRTLYDTIVLSRFGAKREQWERMRGTTASTACFYLYRHKDFMNTWRNPLNLNRLEEGESSRAGKLGLSRETAASSVSWNMRNESEKVGNQWAHTLLFKSSRLQDKASTT